MRFLGFRGCDVDWFWFENRFVIGVGVFRDFWDGFSCRDAFGLILRVSFDVNTVKIWECDYIAERIGIWILELEELLDRVGNKFLLGIILIIF